MERLRTRDRFLAAAKGRRWTTPGFVVQCTKRLEADGAIGVGFTASRKVGGAVQRNRAKRRLRELVRVALPTHGRPDRDYVLVARTESVSRLFATMRGELEEALTRLAGSVR